MIFSLLHEWQLDFKRVIFFFTNVADTGLMYKSLVLLQAALYLMNSDVQWDTIYFQIKMVLDQDGFCGQLVQLLLLMPDRLL